jgi:hypothetical protein
VNLLRFVLVFLSMLGPPVGQAAAAQFTEEEVTHVCEAAAVEARALGLQPPPPPPPSPGRAARRLRRARRRPPSTRSPARRRRRVPLRVARRLLFGSDDDEPDSAH